MAIGDVDRHGEHRPGAVLGGANVADAVVDPDERPVGTDVAFLYLIGSRGFDETVKLLKVAGQVVRMRAVLPLEVAQFLPPEPHALAIANSEGRRVGHAGVSS